MNSGLRQIFTVLALLLAAISMPAQDIPVLPEDPAVVKGVLPNGMSYYLVANAADKGVADFALVQNTGFRTVPDSLSANVAQAASDALSFLPRISPSVPLEFLSRNGIAPGRKGYVRITDDATVYLLEDVSLAMNKSVTDSTLLMLMDIADRGTTSGDGFVAEWYSPSDQAVIVAGDIDAKAVAERLKYMSYMIPSGDSAPRADHVWDGKDEMVIVRDTVCTSPFSEVSMTWVSQRVPREYMNTVQPAIFEMAVSTLGEIAVRRVRDVLEDKSISVADVSYGHVCSESSPYDDSFTISAVVRCQDAARTLESLTEVMASIDASGACLDEFLLAEAKCLAAMSADASSVRKLNSEYVDRCMNAFLYNASLASPKERLAFHNSRRLPEPMRLKLFNDIAMAMLDSSANLTVRYQGDSLAARETLDSVWSAAVLNQSAFPSRINMSDTLSFPEKSHKVKLKNERKEHVSGGSIWTFSNGFKVIYKKMPADGLHYTLALNGGYSSIRGLDPGEGAFMSDYLHSCYIAGLKTETFLDILMTEGISMDFKVNLSNMMISGHAPSENIRLLLRSLLAVANERSRNDEAFGYYKECEYLSLEYSQGGRMSRMTAIDSIMSPDYRYSHYKTVGNISDGFQDKAEAFFDEMSSKMNDGVLVLAGNMNEEKLKKILMEYVGGFRTQDIAFRRPALRYQPVSGWTTYTVDGNRDCVDIALSARMPITAENYIAADIAATVVRRRLAEALSSSGMHAEVSNNCRIYPEERYNMMVSVYDCPPMEALARVRMVLSGLHEIEIGEDELKVIKSRLKNMVTVEMKDPVYWVDAIVLRYLDGKDLSTGYGAKIDAVTASRVQSVLNMLDAGCKVEYVTRKKY